MKTVVIYAALILVTSGSSWAAGDDVVGTWRLVSFKRHIVATGETNDLFGKAPQGFINYGRDGRMIGLFVADGRPHPEDPTKLSDQQRIELFKTMVSYGGTYTLNNDTITHHIDISWNQVWTGTNQLRHIKFDGRRMTLTTDPAVGALDGKMGYSVLTWEKVE